MSYNVKLEVFEGPFDLLFHLIEKAKVDIYNIPIADIAQQYIQYVEDMKKFDLEVASEFLVMAATLIEIKSKMLLPNKQEEQLEFELLEDDPRQDLVKRLIEYKKYKNAALEFKNREEVYKKIFYKQQEQLDQFLKYEPKELSDLEIDDLLDAFNRLLSRMRTKNENKISIRQIQRDEVSIEDKINQIRNLLVQNPLLEFEKLFVDPFNKSEVVVTFLALLELIKLKILVVKQDKIFGNITVTRNIIGNEVQ